ncbi:hypothetical protein M7I_3818 [Glarea lozoyensis 74030]|uniref:Uncharacterized protein n=1 Tax=Glarea lozoyensis (strain ATCC 74030 / MF5533) TaxID=1104152 RepID=H0EMI1_GLAL7|nr:hypothetical protein M7I_3818 [Glarea lozoyensis 74030]
MDAEAEEAVLDGLDVGECERGEGFKGCVEEGLEGLTKECVDTRGEASEDVRLDIGEKGVNESNLDFGKGIRKSFKFQGWRRMRVGQGVWGVFEKSWIPQL